MLDQTTGRHAQVDSDDLSSSLDQKDILDPAHYIGNFLLICTSVLTLIGIPINILVIGAIVFIKRLHFPRNIIWIGMGVANIFVLVSRLMLVIATHLDTSTVSNRGFYTWFLFNSSLFLALNIVSTVLERYICITYPKWHKRVITIKFVIVFAFSMLVFVFLMPMITANLDIFQPYLTSFFDSWNFKLVGTIFAIIVPLFLTGLVGFLAIFKKQTQQQNSPSVPSIDRSSLSVNRPHLPVANLLDGNSLTTTYAADERENKAKKRKSHFVIIGNNRISEAELKARETFHCIAYIFLIFMAPILMSFISALICLQVSASSCPSFIGAFYHFGIIMHCLHSSIANPIAFVVLSKDLLSCFKSRAYRNRSGFKQESKEDEMMAQPNLETINEKPDEETAM